MDDPDSVLECAVAENDSDVDADWCTVCEGRLLDIEIERVALSVADWPVTDTRSVFVIDSLFEKVVECSIDAEEECV